MFLRKCRQRKNGQEYAYWQLVENYRTERGPRQRVVAHLAHDLVKLLVFLRVKGNQSFVLPW